MSATKTGDFLSPRPCRCAVKIRFEQFNLDVLNVTTYRIHTKLSLLAATYFLDDKY